MRIVGTSNFNREDFSEFFTEDNGTQEELQSICDGKNSDYSSIFFKVVDDDFELYKWEPF